MIDLTQEELKVLVAVLDLASFRLVDMPKIFPLRQKLWGEIAVEEKIEPTEVIKPKEEIV